MASSNRNERAWTPQDVKALECAMINKLEIGITSIDKDEILNPNKLPLDATPTDFWGQETRVGEIHIYELKHPGQRNGCQS